MASQNENLDIVALLDSVSDETVNRLMFELSPGVSSDLGDREGVKMLNPCDSTSAAEEGTSNDETRMCQLVELDEPCATLKQHFLSTALCSEKSLADLKPPPPEEANQRVPCVFQREMPSASQQSACQKEADSKQTKKKQRWMFSRSHKQELEAAFKENVYPSKWRLAELSESLVIPLPTLRVWFQNKRWRLRKNSETSSTPSMSRSKKRSQGRTREVKKKILPPDKKPVLPKCAALSSVGISLGEDNAGTPLTSGPLTATSSVLLTAASSGLTQAASVLSNMPSENRHEHTASSPHMPSVKVGWNTMPFYWSQPHFPFPTSPYSPSCSYPLPIQANISASSAKSTVSGLIPPAYSGTCFSHFPALRLLSSASHSAAVDPSSSELVPNAESCLPSPLFPSLSSCAQVCLCAACLHAALPVPNALSSWSFYGSPFSAPIPRGLVPQHHTRESNQPNAGNSSDLPSMFGWGLPSICSSPFFPAFSTSAGNSLPIPSQTPHTLADHIALQCLGTKETADRTALSTAASSSLKCTLPSGCATEASSAGMSSSSSCQGEDLFANFSGESEDEN